MHTLKGPISRIDPFARKVTNSVGNGIVYNPKAFDWGDDNFDMATGNNLVLYEMHVGTFNVKEEGWPGTFDSAMEKLPYLNELGVNAVEVMPIAEFPGDSNGNLPSGKPERSRRRTIPWRPATRLGLVTAVKYYVAGPAGYGP